MLHTPVARFEPFRRVAADRLIHLHEGHRWQPFNGSRKNARTDVRALHLGLRLQRRPRRPLTLSCEAGLWSRPRDGSRAAQSSLRGLEGREAGTGSIWKPRWRDRPYRRPMCPIRGRGASCACVPGGAGGGPTRRASGLAARHIYMAGGHGEGSSGSPCHSASGLGSTVGQAAVACAFALVDFWVPRLPCPVRRKARLSWPRHLRVGGAVFCAHSDWGNSFGLIATEEPGARLVSQSVDPRS